MTRLDTHRQIHARFADVRSIAQRLEVQEEVKEILQQSVTVAEVGQELLAALTGLTDFAEEK